MLWDTQLITLYISFNERIPCDCCIGGIWAYNCWWNRAGSWGKFSMNTSNFRTEIAMVKFQDYNSQVDIAGLQWFQWFSIIMTLVTNGYMILFIMKQQSKTFLDWMIVFDSGLCINQCYSIAAIGSKIQIACGFSVKFFFETKILD